MPSDRHVIDGVEHVLLHNPSKPADQILVPVGEAAAAQAEPEDDGEAP